MRYRDGINNVILNIILNEKRKRCRSYFLSILHCRTQFDLYMEIFSPVIVIELPNNTLIIFTKFSELIVVIIDIIRLVFCRPTFNTHILTN